VDKTEVFLELALYGKRTSTKVYILNNDKEFLGMVAFLPLYFNYNKSNMSKKSENRTPSDAIRVAAIMLDPKHRGSVGGFLKGVINRAKQ